VTAFFWFLLGLIGLTLGLHLAAKLVYLPATAKIFGQTPWLPSGWREPLEEGQAVELTTADGTHLQGTYLNAVSGQRQGVIACCHEFNGDRWNMLPYANDLRQRGFDIFAFDFRNHGNSDRMPGYEPTPWVTSYEVSDVHAALDYLASRGDAPRQGIGLFGVGRGATAALCAAADPRVAAVAVDGACPTERMQIVALRDFLANSLPWSGWIDRVPDLVFEPLARWARLIIGYRRHCRFVSVLGGARRVTKPTLMIHGQCDPHVPVDLVYSLRDALAGWLDLWVVPCANHNGAIHVAPAEYHERVARFFLEHLAPEAVAPLATTRRVDASTIANNQHQHRHQDVPVVQGL
jgi:pimeloyl-ACP methyl ester carboxylesterase